MHLGTADCFHTEWGYHAVKQQPFSFSDRGQFQQWWLTGSSSLSLSSKSCLRNRTQKDKNTDLKDNMWQSISNQSRQLDSCCSVFSDVIASVGKRHNCPNMFWTVHGSVSALLRGGELQILSKRFSFMCLSLNLRKKKNRLLSQLFLFLSPLWVLHQRQSTSVLFWGFFWHIINTENGHHHFDIHSHWMVTCSEDALKKTKQKKKTCFSPFFNFLPWRFHGN